MVYFDQRLFFLLFFFMIRALSGGNVQQPVELLGQAREEHVHTGNSSVGWGRLVKKATGIEQWEA